MENYKKSLYCLAEKFGGNYIRRIGLNHWEQNIGEYLNLRHFYSRVLNLAKLAISLIFAKNCIYHNNVITSNLTETRKIIILANVRYN